MSEEITEREKYFVTFFGDQPRYYLEEYRHQYFGRKWSFNIGSFFFGFLWFIYRKMYVIAFILFVVNLLLGQLEEWIYTQYEISFDIRKVTSFIVPIAWGFATGFTGNYFYAKFATKKVDEILQAYPDHEKRMTELKRQGGITYLPYLVAALLMLVYFLLLKSNT